MIAIRNILCPIDLSACADHALAYAAELTEKLAAKLTVFYAVPDGVLPMPDATMPMPVSALDADQLLADGRAAVAGKVAPVARVNPAVEVRLGSAETEIVEFAKALPADLIVLGTHGRRGLAHFFLGSVAEKIVRTAPCPVLTVRG